MTRSYFISGETLVRVKASQYGAFSDLQGAPAPPFNNNGILFDLGLSVDGIEILPEFYHQDIYVDDLGDKTPAEILQKLASCRIRMKLVHYDLFVLDSCFAESVAGGGLDTTFTGDIVPGIMPAGGTPMGGGVPLYNKGNHYVSLNVLSPQGLRPWLFFNTYIDAPPIRYPLGTSASEVEIEFRAVLNPGYVTPVINSVTRSRVFFNARNATNPPEIVSSGADLWAYTQLVS